MCGIFSYLGDSQQAAQIVFSGLKSLEYRGYDSWGVAVIPTQGKQIQIKKRVGKIGQANVDQLSSGNLAIGHTRWATHGGVTQLNAHPHLDCSGKIAVVHNGIIENYLPLKNKLKQQTHQFVSETDTEVVSHLLEKYCQQMSLAKAIRKVFKNITGHNAIIATHLEEQQIVAAKNGSPLVIGFTSNATYLASDPSALLPYTKTVYFLQDGEMAVIEVNKVSLFDLQTGKELLINKQELAWQSTNLDKGKYHYFMEKEILEQDRVITQIATSNSYAPVTELIKKAKQIYVIGCGTASYAAWASQYIFAQVADQKINWCVAEEFAHLLKFVDQDTLIIAISQSGETMDIIETVNQAKKRGAKIIALTNVLGSTLFRLADDSILIGAGPEKGVASTKAFVGMLSHLIMLAYSLKGLPEVGQKMLLDTAQEVKKITSPLMRIKIKGLASQLKDDDKLFVIGRGIANIAAAEIALKIKEISYIHAESVIGGELKHGPLALIEKGVKCLVIVFADDYYLATIGSSMEIKARGAEIIGISSQDSPVFDQLIKFKDRELGSLILAVIIGQLLSYELTLLKGLDPDMPRNLAKSVTVG